MSLVSEKDYRKALQTLINYRFIGEYDQARSDIYEKIIEIVLYLHIDRQPFSYIAIQGMIKDDLFGIFLPLNIIEKTCYEMFENEIIRIEDDMIYLEGRTRVKIEEQIINNNKLKKNIEDMFLDFFMSEYRRDISMPLYAQEETNIRSVFWKYISDLLYYKIIHVNQILDKVDIQYDDSIKSILFKELEKDLPEGKLRKSFKASFIKLLKSDIPIFIDYIYYSHKLLICWNMLSSDKSIDIFQEVEFSNKRILLDTNILMSLLCVDEYSHKSIEELLEVSQSIGVRFFVTDKTIREYRRVIDRSNEKIIELDIPFKILRTLDDDILRSYAVEREQDRELSWAKYYKKYANPIKFLYTKYNVDYREVDNIDFISDVKFDTISKAVSTEWQKRVGYLKAKKIADHDAFHLLLVKQLREEDINKTVLGPNYWFLTKDSTLIGVNEHINNLRQFKSMISSSIREFTWMDYIIPFINTKDEQKNKEAFYELLKTEFSTIPRGISHKVLLGLKGEWMSYDWLKIKDVEDILEDNVIQTLSLQLNKIEDVNEARTIINDLKRQFNTLMTTIFNERIVEVKTEFDNKIKELREVKKEVSDKEEQISSLEKEKIKDIHFRRNWRTIIGGLGIILFGMSLGLLRNIKSPTNIDLWLTFGVLSAGILCIFICIAYEQVQVKLSAPSIIP